MSMLNDKNINYHASFVIDHQDSKRSFYEVLNVLKLWVKEKEEKFGNRNFRSLYSVLNNFDQNHSKEFDKGTNKRRLEISTVETDEKRMWGFQYSHPQFNSKISMLIRFWYVEVYITSFKNTNKLAIYVCVSYSWNRTKMLEEKDAKTPSPTVPGFINKLVHSFQLHMEGCKYNFSSKPYLLKSKDDIKPFIELLKDEDRNVFILLSTFSPTYNAAEKFLSNLAKKVLGKALFFHVDPSTEAFKILKKSNLINNIFDNRIYIISEPRKGHLLYQWIESPPGPTAAYFDLTSNRLQEFFYRNQIVLAEGAITSFSQISSAIAYKRLQQKRQEALSAQDETMKAQQEAEESDNKAREAESLFEEIYEEKENLGREYAQLLDDNKNLKSSLKHTQLESSRRIKDLEDEKGAMVSSSIDCIYKSSLCKKLREKVECFKDLLSSRLIFTDNALDSLEECNKLDEDLVVPGLIALYNSLWPLYVDEDLGGRVEDKFAESRFEYAQHETSGTMANPEFRRARTVVYNGKPYVCEEHLKFGKNGRMYFTFDKKLKKIVLCSLGPHLDTAGTRRKSH